ncbi:MAG: Crp/Fnr family transcriptional regulator [Celeribacter marinus]
MTIHDRATNPADRAPHWVAHLRDPTARERVLRLLAEHTRHYATGAQFINEDDTLNTIVCVLSGWVSISKVSETGQIQIIDFGMPGDLYDLTSADGRTTPLNVTVVSDASIASIPRALWRSLVIDYPEIERLSRDHAASAMSRVSERMLRLGKGSAEERIAYGFLELGVRLADSSGQRSNCYDVPLTQLLLAEWLGLSSVHVCRTLQALNTHGAVEVSGHMKICVMDADALAKIAGVSFETLAQEISPPH